MNPATPSCGAFIQAGAWALVAIAILLWIALRRFGDVLLTLVPLLLAGAVTLEICVLIGMPLNFANIIALPLLLGIGVAFKIYYVMAWRVGRTKLLQSSLTRAVILQRRHHGYRIRQPVVLQPSRDVEHGQAVGPVALLHAGGGRAISARPYGQPPRLLSRRSEWAPVCRCAERPQQLPPSAPARRPRP